jgi:hypothetical protein
MQNQKILHCEELWFFTALGRWELVPMAVKNQSSSRPRRPSMNFAAQLPSWPWRTFELVLVGAMRAELMFDLFVAGIRAAIPIPAATSSKFLSKKIRKIKWPNLSSTAHFLHDRAQDWLLILHLLSKTKKTSPWRIGFFMALGTNSWCRELVPMAVKNPIFHSKEGWVHVRPFLLREFKLQLGFPQQLVRIVFEKITIKKKWPSLNFVAQECAKLKLGLSPTTTMQNEKKERKKKKPCCEELGSSRHWVPIVGVDNCNRWLWKTQILDGKKG